MSRRFFLMLAALLALSILPGTAEEIPASAAEQEPPIVAEEAVSDEAPVSEDAVREAQQCLAGLGFYDDAVDGKLHVANASIEESLQLGGNWVFTTTGGLGIRYIGGT